MPDETPASNDPVCTAAIMFVINYYYIVATSMSNTYQMYAYDIADVKGSNVSFSYEDCSLQMQIDSGLWSFNTHSTADAMITSAQH